MKYLALILIFLTATPAEAAWKWVGGAELNSITDGVEVTTNSAPFATSTSPVHSGTYSYRVNAGAGFGRQVIYTANQTATSTARVWYYPVARPNAATQFMRYSTTGNVSVGNITMNTDGTLVLLASNGTQIGSASSALPLNTWSCVELKTDSSAATGKLEARLNGTTFASGNNSNQGSWARFLFGNITGAQTTNDGYFDDIAVTDSSAPAITYPGCGSLAFVQPDAAGDTNQWLQTGGGAGSATNYTLVDERPPNDATDFVNSGTLNNSDLYNFASPGVQSYDTVNALLIGTRHNNNVADATTAFQIQWEAASGGTIATGSSVIPNTTTWTSYGPGATTGDTYRFATSTDTTGATLTSTILNAMQAGLKLSAANVNRIQVTTIWAYVDYTPGTPPAANTDTWFYEF